MLSGSHTMSAQLILTQVGESEDLSTPLCPHTLPVFPWGEVWLWAQGLRVSLREPQLRAAATTLPQLGNESPPGGACPPPPPLSPSLSSLYLHCCLPSPLNPEPKTKAEWMESPS